MTRILLVDSDRKQRELYGSQLSKDGYEVVAVDTGREALKKLGSEQMDAVVLELQLPDMCGLRFMGDVISRQRRLPIIINTDSGYFRDDFKSWAADAFLDKSSDCSALRHALKRLAPIARKP